MMRDERMKKAAKEEAEMKGILNTPGVSKAESMKERPAKMKQTHDSAMMHTY